MCQNISAFDKSNKNSSLNNTCPDKRLGIACIRLRVPGFKQECVTLSSNQLVVHLSGIRKTSCCPHCGQRSRHVHSYYFRHIQAGECLDMSTVLLVKARRFRCKHCARTFSEPLPDIAPRYGRKTREVLDRITSVSLKTTSRIASYLLELQHIHCSASTCLRSIDRNTPTFHATAIGIDDAAKRKGRTYMSVVVDQHSRQTIALLNCRSGEELDNYLLENQQIQFVTRDGSVTYADAINRCLPDAVQISDKFHLVKNMLDALADEFSRMLRSFSAEKKTYSFPTVSECKAEIMKDFLNLGEQRHRERLQFFIEADNAYREGKSYYQIAQAYNMHTEKVRKLLFKHTRKDYMSDEQKLILKFIDKLALELSQGCYKVNQLVKKLDNKLSASDIKRVSQTLRNSIESQRKNINKENSSIAKKKKENHIPKKTIQRFILNGTPKSEKLDKLYQNRQAKQAIELAQEFRQILNGSSSKPLEGWLKRAEKAKSEAIRAFAKYVKSDQSAVKAAIDYGWNNALLEGSVNKLKAIKRQMYNRANIDLLLAKIKGFST